MSKTVSKNRGDEGLVCPSCGYNLTGLREERCPECGEPFDRDELVSLQRGDVGPIPCWDDRAEPGTWVRFCKLCLMIWFTPGRFGRQMPAGWREESALRFHRWVLVVTVLVYVVASALTWFTSMLPGTNSEPLLKFLPLVCIPPLMAATYFVAGGVTVVCESQLKRKVHIEDEWNCYSTGLWFDFILFFCSFGALFCDCGRGHLCYRFGHGAY